MGPHLTCQGPETRPSGYRGPVPRYGHRELAPGEPPPEGSVIVPRANLDHLAEQLGFLDASCAAYDTGNQAEVKRLATTVRVLVHDTRKSTSLLRRLGVKTSFPWADGIVKAIFDDVRKHQLAGETYSGCLLTTVKMAVGFLEDHSKVRYVPVYEIQPLGERLAPFDYWWTQPRLADTEGTNFSRRDIVTVLANKDGGAHVDELPAHYERIVNGSSMGVYLSRLDGKTARDDSPIPAAMRQVAEETRWSIRRALEIHLYAQAHPRALGD